MDLSQRFDLATSTEIDWFGLAAGRLESPETMRRIARSFQLAQEVGRIGCYEIDMRTGVTYATPTFFDQYGLPREKLRLSSEEWRRHVHPADWHMVRNHLHDVLTSIDLGAIEYRIITTGGETRWVSSRTRVERDANGQPTMAYGMQQDVTDRRCVEDEVRWIANHDPLTGLANRTLFQQHLEAACQSAGAVLLLVDLDRFKTVNDTLGHPTGDALLRAVAGRLRKAAPPGATVARLGGDEFALLIPCLTGDVEPLAGQLVDLLSRPFLLLGHVVEVGASIGMAVAPADAQDAEMLVRAADLALYGAKAGGRGGWRRFEPGMDSAARSRQELLVDLRRALALGALRLHYQPQLAAIGDAVVGFEALVRWERPGHGLVPPNDFIPLAEETGLINAIGDWVLHCATREAMRWPGDMRVAVNLSPRQLEDGDRIVTSVMRALADSGLPAWRLELEVTETGLAAAGEGGLQQLHRLRELGVRVSIDDFGTGHSSLSRLLEFPFDSIKVDRSFVAGLGHDEKAGALVRSIAALARSLNVTSVAEGVETREQAMLARHDGFSQIQGYLISRPMPPGDIAGFLAGAAIAGGVDQ